MTISELQKILSRIKRQHGDLVVVAGRYSDFVMVPPDEVSVVEGVKDRQLREWVTRYHQTLPEAQRQKFLCFAGN